MKKILLLCIFFFIHTSECCKNFVLIAAPGSGKGTFSEYLIEKYGYIQIAPGDIFRSEINKQTEFGKKIEPIIAKGEYVDESIVREVIKKNILQALQQKKHFILEGYPHSVESFQFLHTFFKENGITKEVCFLELVASDEICIQRVLNRQVCKNCSHIYNLLTSPPQEKNKCNYCKNELVIRKSDTKDIVQKRLKTFHSQIDPIKKAAQEFYIIKTMKTDYPLQDLHIQYDKLVE